MPNTIADTIPKIGVRLTQDVSLPGVLTKDNRAEAIGSDLSSLRIGEVPTGSALVPVVNALASVETVAFLSRLSGEQLLALRNLYAQGERASRSELIEKVAEDLFLSQGKPITTLNIIGPERWRGVLRTQDAIAGKSYASLSHSDKEVARANVMVLSRALASLPDASFQIIVDLKDIRPGIASFVSPMSSLRDHVTKRAISRNFEAWKVRKTLEQSEHPDSVRTLHELSPANRLFSGLMGLATFQMLRDHGQDVCTGLVALGDKLISLRGISRDALANASHRDQLLTGLTGGDGQHVCLPEATMRHIASTHHDLWLTNRVLTSLLPNELHQPQRIEHQPFNDLDPLSKNQVCLGILCLAISLARDAHDKGSSGSIKDLLQSAASGNPLGLQMKV